MSGRLVWITQRQREALEWMCDLNDPIPDSHREIEAEADAVLSAWDAAPSDPAEAIQRALLSDGRLGNIPPESVLRELGVPAPPQRPTPRDGES